ncbi:oligoribonuclease, mitochondrial [[Candida] railenensis]|uniref:Oligoribonuclease, mitochondrial n=1 Tax=[Candida] railenensis TaxID=45579 RepID=A0A9P0QW30_9ASCO|nr:oligoribonuclease, mitochondrial [[Candida] railenensis]
MNGILSRHIKPYSLLSHHLYAKVYTGPICRLIKYRQPQNVSFRRMQSTKRVKLSPSPDVENLKVTDSAEPESVQEIPESTKESAKKESEVADAGTESVWKPLVWVDCEMTGLNVYEDNIIEICCLITDGNLNLIDDEGYESTIYVPKEKLDAMDEWCLEHHGSSGLIDKVLANKEKTIEVVQEELLQYLTKFMDPKKGILAGNTVHMDRFFMNREMPKVVEFLHYRIIDVSSVMEIGFRHNPNLMKKFPKKKGAHTARSDILESLNQLKWYRDNYFVQPIADESSQEEAPVEAPNDSEIKATIELSTVV